MKPYHLALNTLAAWAMVDLLCAIFEPIAELRSVIKFILFLPLLAHSLPRIVSGHYFSVLFIVSAVFSAVVAFPGSINVTFALRSAAFILFALAVFEALRLAPVNLVLRYVAVYVALISLSALWALFTGRPQVYEVESGFGGVSGGFDSPNELSYLLAFLLATLVAYCYIQRDRAPVVSYTLIFILAANALLLTTKAAVLFALLSIALIIPKMGRWSLVTLACIGAALFLRIDFTYVEDVAAISRFMFFSDRFDLLWALTSGRSERLADFDWNLAAFALPINNSAHNFEMDFFDAIINLGALGILIVVSAAVFAFRHSAGHAATLMLTGAIIALAFLAGHLLNSVAVAPYAALYLSLATRLRGVRFGWVQATPMRAVEAPKELESLR